MTCLCELFPVRVLTVGVALSLLLVCVAVGWAAQGRGWRIGEPIVTYWAGPPMTDATADQMKAGGWNLVWCTEAELDVAQRHGLRAQLTDGLLSPATLDDPAKRAQLDALVGRVAKHPALYSYFITDEPNASTFPAWGKLVAYLREKDPAHLAYLNLFPTYANNDQLGTKGDTVAAYREHLRQYVDIVKPELISYDHYQFMVGHDTDQYFLNLAMIRQAALDAHIPFLNIVQAASWAPGVRVPNGRELSYLVYTSIAYGAQGISYYVYHCAGHQGAMADDAGQPTALYHAAEPLNREFVAMVRELQPLKALGAYHAGMVPPGTEALPADSAFRLDPPLPPQPAATPVKGVLLGCFGPSTRPTHVVVVNLDYNHPATITLVGPRPLQVFDASRGEWLPKGGKSAQLELPPGGGKLVRSS